MPAASDILCGKDKAFHDHPGNTVFAAVIASYQKAYAKKTTKKAKMSMTRAIVKRMQTKHNARFVRLTRDDHWMEIEDAAARDKVSHALRFAAKVAAASGSSPSTPVSQRSRKCHRVEVVNVPCLPASVASTTASTISSMSSWGSDDYFPLDDEAAPVVHDQQVAVVAMKLADDEASVYGPEAEAQLHEFELLSTEDLAKLRNDPIQLFSSDDNVEWNFM